MRAVGLVAGLHVGVVDGLLFGAGVVAQGALFAVAVEDDGAVDEGGEEGASMGGGLVWGGERGFERREMRREEELARVFGVTHSTTMLTTRLRT